MIMIMTKKVHYHDHYEIITLTFLVLAPNLSWFGGTIYVMYGTLNMTSGDVMHHLSEVPCMLVLHIRIRKLVRTMINEFVRHGQT